MGGDHHEAAHTALGILGNIASCLFFISSAPTVVRIVKCKSSGGLSGDLYIFKLFNCMLWCLYGLPFVHPHDLWVVLTNSFGSAFALIYILTYLLYASSKEKTRLLWKLGGVVTSFTILVVMLILLSKSQHQRIVVVGTMSTIVSSAMHITLLSQCKMAIQQREKKFLHPSASVAGFIKGAIWSAYGLVNFDIFILIPNGVGVLIGVIQLILVLYILRSVSSRSSCNENDLEKQAHEKTSLETNVDSSKGADQGKLESTRNDSLTFSNTSRVPSKLGLSRQGSIASNVIVPITLDSDFVDVNIH